MGIDRSVSLGYGVAIKDEDANKYLAAFDSWESDIDKILQASGWDLIGFDYCGDYMSGDNVYFFYVKGTELLHADTDFMPTLTEFSDYTEVGLPALRQLNDVAEHFGVTGPIGWKLVCNVS